MKIKGTVIIAVIALMISSLSKAQNGISNQIIPKTETDRNHKAVNSSISFLSESYIPGTTVDLQFFYTYSSPDGEWNDGVSLSFPAGVFVNDASVCTVTGYQQLPYNGETGDGITASWGNIDGGSGVGALKSSGQFSVNVTIGEAFSGPLSIDWYVAGDGYGAAPHHASGTISLAQALNNDLEVAGAKPTFVKLGNDFVPVVSIRNVGIQTSTFFSVSVEVPGFDYFEEISVSNPLISNETIQLVFPAFTPSQAMAYDAAVSITEGGGEIESNDTLTIHGIVAPLADAYAINGWNTTYNIVNLESGDMVNVGDVDPSQWQMAEEFDGNYIYRINADASIGTVDPDGTFHHIGYMSGVPGWTAALAYNWNTNLMYVVAQNEQTDYSHLCLLDMETLQLTEIAVSTQLITGMDFANDGFLYAVTIQDELLKIDPVTAEITVVGPIGIDIAYPQDVSYDVETNKLYTIASGLTFSHFGTYDLHTGAFQFIKDMQGMYFYTLVITKIPTEDISVTFHVDMSTATGFSADTDQVYISGDMNAWAEPGSDDSFLLSPVGEDMEYSATFDLNPGNYTYKYYINAGWDGAEWGDNVPGRTLEVVDDAIVLNDIWGEHPGEYYPITFHLDMSTAEGFSVIDDMVYLSGSMNDWTEPGTDNYYMLSHTDEEMIYTFTIYLAPGNYDYKFFVNSGWNGAEWGDEFPDRTFEVIDAAVELFDVWGDPLTFVNTLLHDLKIYPNPATDYISIESDVVLGKVQLYNRAGQMVYDQKINQHNYSLDVSGFQQGFYIVKIWLSGGELVSISILINR